MALAADARGNRHAVGTTDAAGTIAKTRDLGPWWMQPVWPTLGAFRRRTGWAPANHPDAWAWVIGIETQAFEWLVAALAIVGYRVVAPPHWSMGWSLVLGVGFAVAILTRAVSGMAWPPWWDIRSAPPSHGARTGRETAGDTMRHWPVAVQRDRTPRGRRTRALMGAVIFSPWPAHRAAWWRTVVRDTTLSVRGPVAAAALWPQMDTAARGVLCGEDLAVLLTDPDPAVRLCGVAAMSDVPTGTTGARAVTRPARIR